jgi:hypothetical protein
VYPVGTQADLLELDHILQSSGGITINGLLKLPVNIDIRIAMIIFLGADPFYRRTPEGKFKGAVLRIGEMVIFISSKNTGPVAEIEYCRILKKARR